MKDIIKQIPGVNDSQALRDLRDAVKLRLAELKAEKAAAQLKRLQDRAAKK